MSPRGIAHAGRPDIVVLDLNIPLKKGQEVLAEMAADPELRNIPVAILTSSTSETHLTARYPAGRCVYHVKTDDFLRLQDIVRQVVAHTATNAA